MSRDEIEAAFPSLTAGEYEVTSPATDAYNCVAFAAGDEGRWWWPDPMDDAYWPPEAPRKETLGAFVEAFQLLGFELCTPADLTPGFTAIAIYANGDSPTHMARKYRAGGSLWVSKLGASEDIRHELHQLEGDVYGRVAHYLRRREEEKGTQLG